LSVNINNTHGFTNNKREKLTILVGYGRERETDREFGGRSGVSCSEAAAVPPPQTPAGGDAGCSLTSRRVLPGTVFKVCLFETVQVKKPSRHHFILLAVALSVHLTHWDCFLTNPGGEGGPVCFE